MEPYGSEHFKTLILPQLRFFLNQTFLAQSMQSYSGIFFLKFQSLKFFK